MFELMIMLSRLIFIFLIGYFILLGFLYIAEERDILGYNRASSVFHQRFVIIAVNILAFVIMSYNPADYSYDIATASIGAAFLVIFIYSMAVLRIFHKNSCPLMWNCMFFLLDIGVIMLARLDTTLAQRQLIWIFAGVTLTFFIPMFFKLFKNLDKLALVYLAISWVLILLPFIFGRTIYGATNWVSIIGFTFQPSEIAKFFYIFFLASVFSAEKSYTQMIFPTLMAGGMVVCLVLQRDLGAALIFFMTYLVIVYISTGSALILASGVGFASAAAFFAHRLMPHIQRRVVAWADPWSDISDTGYQITQSLFAIGTWGALGAGLTRGYPYRIPVVYTDFIFSAICEEFGILFGLMIVGVLMMLLFRGTITSLRSQDSFFCILAASITSILAFQSFLILGGVIKLIPLTGVTFPFVSYGGSSILVSIVMTGILSQLSKEIHRTEEEGGESV